MAATKATVYLETGGKQVNVEEITAEVKNRWLASGKLVKDIKSFELYLKPEDNKAYYVINGDEFMGYVEF